MKKSRWDFVNGDRDRLKEVEITVYQGQMGEFHISHDASRLVSVFSLWWKERLRVSREISNDLYFKMQLTQGKFQ